MNKVFKNQNGFALILVLLTIIIIGILVPPLMNSVISNAKQVQISEEIIQKTKLIDMGKLMARNTIEKEINLLTTDVDNAVDDLKTLLTRYEPNPPLSGNLYNQHYEIHYIYNEFVFDQNTKILQIPYIVTAKIMSKSNLAETIGNTITEREVYKIQLLGEFIDWENIQPDDFTNPNLFQQFEKEHYSGTIDGNSNFIGEVQIKPNESFTVNGSAALQDGAHLSNSGTLIINGTFYSRNGTLKIQNDSKIIIGKNAWFYDVTFHFVNRSTICVQGNIKGNSVGPTEATQVSSCAEANGSGIYYVGDYFPDEESTGSGESGSQWNAIGVQ